MLVLLFAIPLLLLRLCAPTLITVETSRGTVQGFDHDFGGNTTQRFYGYGQMFLGIPYAKAPLGERRFMLPEDICQYNDRGEVHNATYYRPRCYQPYDSLTPATDMSEDCLFLNVMTPNASGSYPVMVYIHGGTFVTGGADIYHWKGAVRNLVSRGVVVVTIQYRLGLIGFFTTFTERFPPNRGLYDMILALRWVQEEIANFGGNPDRVTIFGQSAGAGAASDLSLSPLARDLFHQLIQTSGAADFAMETITDPRGSIHQDRAKEICGTNATNWGSTETDDALMDCLLQATPQEMTQFDNVFGKRWNVAIDGALLPDYPSNLAKSRPKYPVLLGDMLEEFAMPVLANGDFTEHANLAVFQRGWPNYDDETARNVSKMMIDGYSGGNVPAENDQLGWAQLVTDTSTGLAFSSSIVRDAQWHHHAGNKNVWLFTLAHRSMLPGPLVTVDALGWIPVGHNSDLPYLWFYPEIWEAYNATAADLATADNMGKLWTDFAKKGKLALPKAGKQMKYVEIDDVLIRKTNWRSTTNTVYNEELPAYLGEFPPLTISDESWAQLHQLGEKLLSKWNSNECAVTPTA